MGAPIPPLSHFARLGISIDEVAGALRAIRSSGADPPLITKTGAVGKTELAFGGPGWLPKAEPIVHSDTSPTGRNAGRK